MGRQIGDIKVEYVQSKRDFSNFWSDQNFYERILPKGWQREPGRRALPEAIIWERILIPLRDGTKLRGDVFRPARLQGTPVPALLPWSPYGKTGTGSCLISFCSRGSNESLHHV